MADCHELASWPTGNNVIGAQLHAAATGSLGDCGMLMHQQGGVKAKAGRYSCQEGHKLNMEIQGESHAIPRKIGTRNGRASMAWAACRSMPHLYHAAVRTKAQGEQPATGVLALHCALRQNRKPEQTPLLPECGARHDVSANWRTAGCPLP